MVKSPIGSLAWETLTGTFVKISERKEWKVEDLVIRGRGRRAQVRVAATGLGLQFEGEEEVLPLCDISLAGLGVFAPSKGFKLNQEVSFTLRNDLNQSEVKLSALIRFQEKRFLGLQFLETQGLEAFLEEVFHPQAIAQSIHAVEYEEDPPPGVEAVYRGNGFELLIFAEGEEKTLQICWMGAVVELSASGHLFFVPAPLVLSSGVVGGAALALELKEVKMDLKDVAEGLKELVKFWTTGPDIFYKRFETLFFD